jgi:hypothetical protein
MRNKASAAGWYAPKVAKRRFPRDYYSYYAAGASDPARAFD